MSESPRRERLSAYQRWELASLEEEPAPAHAIEAELEQLRERARQEGHAAGYAQGLTQSRAEAEALHALVEDTQRELQSCNARIAEALLELALSLARHIMRESLAVRPELVLPVIQECIRALPGFSQGIVLAVHPQDAALVREHLPDRIVQAELRVLEDAAIRRGGCRIETPASAVDATLETRWRRAVSALGGDERWLV